MKKISYYKNSSKLQWLALFGLSLGFSLIYLDTSALNISLPFIQKQFNASTSQVFWVINAYVVALATTALAGGRLGDLLGLRFVFLNGISIFALASILCGAATSSLFLILARYFQGLGGALTISIASTLIYHIFSSKSLGKAIGFFGLASIFFMTIGPAIGGFFTQYLSWRWIFWINPIVGGFSFLIVFCSLKGIDKERDKKARFDYPGQVFLAIAIASLVIALMQGKTWGWVNVWTLILIGSFLFFFMTFLWIERKKRHPLLELRLFKKTNIKIGSLIFFSYQFILAISVLSAFYLIESLEFSAMQAGLALLPPGLISFLSNPLAGHLVDRFGYKQMALFGIALSLITFLWLSLTASYYSYLFFICGIGMTMLTTSIIFISSFVMVMGEAPSHQKGMVSGLIITIRQTGGALCVAIMGTIVAIIKNHSASTISSKVIYMRAFQWATGIIAALLIVTFFFSLFIEKPEKKEMY